MATPAKVRFWNKGSKPFSHSWHFEWIAVFEADPKPTKTITDDPEAIAAKIDAELSEGQIVDDHLSDISSETDFFDDPPEVSIFSIH